MSTPDLEDSLDSYVGLWDILYFPLLGLRGSYLLIFFKSFKSPT